MSAHEPRFDAERNVITLGGARLVFHCHHYNMIFQRSIEDGLGERAPARLFAASMESARRLLEGTEREAPSAGPEALLARASELFASLGFGRADVSRLTARGGTVALGPSHYAVGWSEKFGPRATPVCFFACGYFAAAVALAGGHAPERVTGREVSCSACDGGAACSVVVEVW